MGTLAAAAITDSPNVVAQPEAQWGTSTAWPPRLDVVLRGAERWPKGIEETSGGRFRIDIYPRGQIMPVSA